MALFDKQKKSAGSVSKNAPSEDKKKTPAKKAEVKPAAPASMKELYGANGEAKPQTAAGNAAAEKKSTSRAYRILLKPLVTEKATVLGAENKYLFAVEPRANKIEIAKAIREVYGVKPAAVNIVKVLGKKTRSGRTIGKRKDWKKAIVTLPEGKTIKVYEGV